MDQQRYEPFDIDKGADKLFFIGSAFMIIFLFLMWSEALYIWKAQSKAIAEWLRYSLFNWK